MRMNRNPPVPSPQPTSPSAEVLALRRNWKWAYLSHFLFTYNPVLHLEDIQLSELEDDLAAGTFEVIPTVMQRLLMSLTPHDKRMILENWQHQLRRQSIKRSPEHNLLGTEDDPTDFASLIMTDKLDLFQALCEWQFQNPNLLRARMRDDDEYANWRMEPIAYDAKGNAYWLMGGNRLWIQYAPPRKRVAKSHKRKQPATASTNGRKSAKRKQPAATSSSKVTATASATQAKSKASASNAIGGRPMRETRSRGQLAGSLAGKSRTMGTRVSSRLRGRDEEDIWQPIPEEWLKEEAKDDAAETEDEDELTRKAKGKHTDIDRDVALRSLDDVSELTSLSDLSELPETEDQETNEETNEDEDENFTPTPPPDFSSLNEDVWETVCVNLADWEIFPRRFEKSTHRSEKKFYNLLNGLVPAITEVLRVDVRKKVMEDAVVHRKRSSRIAVKESVREAERAEARRKAEAEKEMERHKRWEARARKEEEERIKRENMRSARLRERGRTGSESADIDIIGGESESKPVLTNGTASGGHVPVVAPPVKFVVNVSKSGTQTPNNDDPWELDCEICHRRGMNLDDGHELMCCERCNKWQHIRCHDQADFIAGRPRRNWELEDFTCAACVAKTQISPHGSLSQHQPTKNQIPRHGSSQHQPTKSQISSHGSSSQHQPQLHHHPDPQVWSHYGVSTNTNGIIPTASQPVPAKSAYSQTSYGSVPYSNGRTPYPLPQAQVQQAHSTSAAPPTQYAHRHQSSTMTSGRSVYPESASPQPRVHAPAPPPAPPTVPPRAPYPSGPNMYLSNYSGNYRPPQHLAGQSPQPSSSSQYRTTMPVVQAGAWSQQPVQYSHLTSHQPWNGTSGSQVSGMSAGQPVPQNHYYRTHLPPAPSNPLASAPQQYYTGGPSSQP